MKPLSPVFLSFVGAIALQTTILGQTASAQVTAPTSIPPLQSQSEFLSTEPVSINRQSPATSHQLPPLSTATLKNIANSIDHRSKATVETPGVPNNLIPKDFFRTLPKPVTDFHPLEPFQVPPPDRGIGINLNHF